MGKLYPVWRKLNYILKWEYFGSLPRSSVHISPSVRRQEWEGENPIFYSVCISHRPCTALAQKEIGKVHYLNHCKMTQHLSSEVIVGGTKTATRLFHRRKLGRRECRRPGQWLHITYSGGRGLYQVFGLLDQGLYHHPRMERLVPPSEERERC